MTDIVERPSVADEDREWINVRADVLFRESERARSSVSLGTIRPQDYRDYFVVTAAYERLADTITALRAELAEAWWNLDVASQNERNLQAELAEAQREREITDKLLQEEAKVHLITLARAETAEAALRSQRAEVLREAAALCEETATDAKETSGECSRVLALWFRGQAKAILALIDAPAPGMTDLMVSPETIDTFMEANPLPDDDAPKEHG